MKNLTLALLAFFLFAPVAQAYTIVYAPSSSDCLISCWNPATDIIRLTPYATNIDLLHEENHSKFKDNTIPHCASFVSSYAATDWYEDAVESATLYMLGGQTFRNLAKNDKCLKRKYAAIKKILKTENNDYWTYGYAVELAPDGARLGYIVGNPPAVADSQPDADEIAYQKWSAAYDAKIEAEAQKIRDTVAAQHAAEKEKGEKYKAAFMLNIENLNAVNQAMLQNESWTDEKAWDRLHQK